MSIYLLSFLTIRRCTFAMARLFFLRLFQRHFLYSFNTIFIDDGLRTFLPDGSSHAEYLQLFIQMAASHGLEN